MQKYLLILLFVCFAACVSAQEQISLKKVLEEKQVEAKFNGNSKSTHYIKPLKGTLKNITKKNLLILIPAGSFFSSEPEDYQDIVITQDLLLSLAPNQSRSLELLGVCVESSNSSPSDATHYTLAPSPHPHYETLAKFVNEKKYYGLSETQHAFWVLSDSLEMIEVYGSQEKASLDLLEQLSQLTQQVIPDLSEVKKYYQLDLNGQNISTFTNPPRRSMSGSFFFQLNKTKRVQIGMFTEQGVLVRELYLNPTCPIGNHKVEYAFDATVYADPVYHFKLITDDYIWIDMPVGER